jgi:hypothetical protein
MLFLAAAAAMLVWLVGSRNPFTPAGYVGYLTKGAIFGRSTLGGRGSRDWEAEGAETGRQREQRLGGREQRAQRRSHAEIAKGRGSSSSVEQC